MKLQEINIRDPFIYVEDEGKRRASQVLVCDEPFGTYVPSSSPSLCKKSLGPL